MASSDRVVRPITDDDWDSWYNALELAFGEVDPPELNASYRERCDLNRALACVENGEIVGAAGHYAFTMTVPGGSVPVAGVTAVGVLPTHRRRGILTDLMRHQLHGLHANGVEPVAILQASESL